jgi:hypothetical protein
MRGGARLIFINMPARYSAHRAFVAISDRAALLPEIRPAP